VAQALVVCGGDIEAADVYAGTILVADGDVTLTDSTHSNTTSLVIATGNIKTDLGRGVDSGLRVTGCGLVAGGSITSPAASHTENSHLYAGKKVALKKGEQSKFGTHREGFDFRDLGLKFFRLSEVGLETTAADETELKSVDAKSPFALALHRGDLIAEVNGRKASTAAEFQRAIRAAVVVEYAAVTLKRDGKELKRLVYLPATLPAKK